MDNNNQPKRIYSSAETVFAWICVIAGYLFCRAYPATINPFGTLIFTVLLFCVTAVIMALNNASFGVVSILSAVSALALSFSLIFTQNSFIHFFAAFYCICAYSLFIYTAYGNHNPKDFARLFPLDFLKALIISPITTKTTVSLGGKSARILLHKLLSCSLALSMPRLSPICKSEIITISISLTLGLTSIKG